MLQIKVFQNGANRIYVTRSFEGEDGKENEKYRFMRAVVNVDLGNTRIISFKDAVSGAQIFVSPVTCLIEVEEMVDE